MLGKQINKTKKHFFFQKVLRSLDAGRESSPHNVVDTLQPVCNCNLPQSLPGGTQVSSERQGRKEPGAAACGGFESKLTKLYKDMGTKAKWKRKPKWEKVHSCLAAPEVISGWVGLHPGSSNAIVLCMSNFWVPLSNSSSADKAFLWTKQSVYAYQKYISVRE